MRLVDLDTKVTTWRYNFDKEEYVAVQTTVGEMIDLNTHEGLSIPIVEIPEPHGRLIDADALRAKMYHEAFETDTPMQKWDSGCWIRYKMFEDMEESAPTIIPAESEGE